MSLIVAAVVELEFEEEDFVAVDAAAALAEFVGVADEDVEEGSAVLFAVSGSSVCC